MDISGIKDKIDLEEGRWIGSIPFPGMAGVEFHVRSANYKPFQRARDKGFRDLALAEGDDAEDGFWAITAKAMAEHLLINWRGIVMGGEEAKFNPALAVELLTADDPHGIGDRFRKSVDWASSKIAADLMAKTEKVAKN